MTKQSAYRQTALHLIFVPALITLVVTLLRVLGELQHWSQSWFSTETGGILPSGTGWLIGISWLPIPFGIYFAARLSALRLGPSNALKAIGFAFLGILIIGVGLFGMVAHIPLKFPHILIFIWLTMAVAAIIQLPGWPALFKTLLAYGLAARVPVMIVMFMAMRGNWGTHYDYVGMPSPFQMRFWPKFLWLAFFPQLIFWVAFTILLGSLSANLTYAVLKRRDNF